MAIALLIGKLHRRGAEPTPTPALPDSEKPGLFRVKGKRLVGRMTAQPDNCSVFCVMVIELPLSLVSIKPITTTTTTNFESKQSD